MSERLRPSPLGERKRYEVDVAGEKRTAGGEVMKNASETPRRRKKFISYEIRFLPRDLSLTNLRQQIKYRFILTVRQVLVLLVHLFCSLSPPRQDPRHSSV